MRKSEIPVAEVPELLAAWIDDADPRHVMVGDHRQYKFRCSSGHRPRLTPSTFLHSGCASCKAVATRANTETKRKNALARGEANVFHLGELAELWDADRNGTPDFAAAPRDKFHPHWWRDPVCGHRWQASTYLPFKDRGFRCLVCRTVLDSFGRNFPQLSAEWSPNNPSTPWHFRPTSKTPFKPEWVCANDANHVWTASLSQRTYGSACPACRVSGKSSPELAHLEAAQAQFGNAASNLPVRSEAFQAREVWRPDITVKMPHNTIYIEYDGAYWHADKHEVDSAKSVDLLATGALVVRLREIPLPSLALEHENYLELSVHGAAPDPDRTIRRISAWLGRRAE